MKAMDFIDSVVPRGGTYCIVGIKDKKVIQKFATTLEEAKGLIGQSVKQGLNTYFALASFKDGSARTKDNAQELKSFYLDIDCGDADKFDKKVGYLTKADAYVAVEKFVNDTGLPQPIMVDSGGGWHIYWVLDTALSKDAWEPIANQFKKLCIAKELYIDPAVPADAARVLRVPNTPNIKRNEVVKFASEVIPEPISLTQFETPLREAAKEAGVDPMAAFLNAPRRELDETTKALLGNKSAKFSTIASKSLKGEGCNQIRVGIVDAATLEEPRWRAVLSIANVCEDRDVAIHKISSKHPDYSAEATERKATETKGPYKCITFEENWSEACANCPHKGNITSPIQLGAYTVFAKSNEVEIPAPPQESAQESQAPIVATPQKIVFPKLPFPYERGVTGGIYRNNKDEAGNPVVDLVYEHDLFVMRRINDANDGEIVLFNLVLPMDGLQEFAIPLKYIGSADKLRDALGHHGVTAGKKKMEGIMSYILAANAELQQRMKREQSRAQFGWHDNDSVFICGRREIAGTTLRSSPPSTQTINLAQWLEPKGSYDEWKSVMKVLGRKGWEKHQLGALAAFGAPLMKFTGEHGLSINLIAGDSGTGKTLIQHFINSVYGNTNYLMLRKADTIAARTHRFGIMNNLPICQDEMTNITPDETSEMIYSFSEGRGRNRLESGANKERVNQTWWASLNIMSSNASMSDKLTSRKANADPELMRLFEIEIMQAEQLDPDYAQGLKVVLEHNYGIAGEIYLKAITKDPKGVKELLKKVKSKVNKLLGTKSKERFWVCGFSAMLTGGYIAKSLGIIDWDIDALFEYLIQLAQAKRTEVDGEALDYKSILGEFLSDNKGAILQINGKLDARTQLPNAPIFNPNIKIVGRYEPDTNIMYIVRSAFKDYCVRRQIPFNAAVTKIQGGIVHKGVDKLRIMRGTGVNAPAVHVLIFEGEFGEDLNDAINTELSGTTDS
jgi:hypothetical protein